MRACFGQLLISAFVEWKVLVNHMLLILSSRQISLAYCSQLVNCTETIEK